MEVIPGVYKHYKGKKYRVLGIAKHSETLDDLVVYEALYENCLSKLWVRPASEFADCLELKGREVRRFEYLGDR